MGAGRSRVGTFACCDQERVVGDDGGVDGLELGRDDILPREQLEKQHLHHCGAKHRELERRAGAQSLNAELEHKTTELCKSAERPSEREQEERALQY